jgi:hypothetical protein
MTLSAIVRVQTVRFARPATRFRKAVAALSRRPLRMLKSQKPRPSCSLPVKPAFARAPSAIPAARKSA